MGKGVNLEKLIEQAVSHALEAQLPQIKHALVAQVTQAISSHAPQGNTPEEKTGEAAGAGTASLLKAVSAVHAGTTQKEILRALLEGTQHYSSRAALFVVKGGNAVGWQGRGFSSSDSIKDFPLDVNSGPAAQALHSRAATTANAVDLDSAFISEFGAPTDGNVAVLPLLLKEKVAALVYADGGAEAGGHLDATALELLVTATSSWLEAVSSRKQSQKEAREQDSDPQEGPGVQTVSSYSDPFAGHSPAFAAAAAAPIAAAAGAAAGAGSGSHAAGSVSAPAMSPEDAETHRKAQRFARLLVDEIKLYNQAKVTEGRKNRDIYDRLKEDIEKSRSMYLKRYGATVAANADYFSNEVIRSLAEDDSSLMGANFRR